MNRYTVRISVLERKPANGPSAVFGQTLQDKLLDATVTTDNLGDVRTIVDGLLFEGIPDTQREDEKVSEVRVSAVQRERVLPPTVDASGDLGRPLEDVIGSGNGPIVADPLA